MHVEPRNVYARNYIYMKKKCFFITELTWFTYVPVLFSMTTRGGESGVSLHVVKSDW